MYGLGRIYSPDERDRGHMLSPRPLSLAPRSRYWYSADVLDQGSTPQCVAYAGHKYMTAGPIRNLTFPYAPAQLYHLCQQNDEWPGTDYDGTSVRGLFKALKQLGYVSGYAWTWDVEVLMAHVLTVGPVVVGTAWYDAMFEPGGDGVVRPTGHEAGGHSYTIIGGNRITAWCRILNSWGEGWGQKGRAWISFEDMQTLLDHQGEACTATEVLKP